MISFRPLLFFLPFSISFCYRWFRFAFVGFVLFRFHFVDFVSFRFVFVDFVSFRFVSHFIGTHFIFKSCVDFIFHQQSLDYYWLVIILMWFLYDKVCQWLAAGQWFFQGTPVSSTNKTGRIKLAVTKQEVYCFISTIIQAI